MKIFGKGKLAANVKTQIGNNKKVIENYFFMTLLQILNSLFYLLIYPFLIRTLGMHNYGLYVFAYSVTIYFVSFIQFGFDTPALKEISENPTDLRVHSKVVSRVLFSKIGIFLVSLMVFVVLLTSVSIFHANFWLFVICYFQVFSNILFPTFYFQGIQKMRVVTYIQLFFKLASLPFLFFLIHKPQDILLFAAITVSTGVLGGVAAMIILRFKYLLKFVWIPISTVRQGYMDAFPFFLSSTMITIKQQTATVLIGSFFSMADVALYDLAMKIYSVPATLIASINGALFPKMLNSRWSLIKRVIKIENGIGVVIILFLILFGKKVIEVMGGNSMLDAYPILVILSFSVFTTLSVGAIVYFVLIPKGLYKFVAVNQFLALIAFLLVSLCGIVVFENVLVIPAAFAVSAFVELGYISLLINRMKNNL